MLVTITFIMPKRWQENTIANKHTLIIHLYINSSDFTKYHLGVVLGKVKERKTKRDRTKEREILQLQTLSGLGEDQQQLQKYTLQKKKNLVYLLRKFFGNMYQNYHICKTYGSWGSKKGSYIQKIFSVIFTVMLRMLTPKSE